ncbi:hypothetical protein GGI42DRAFT_23233 [Trichoderma sp. SZMC 28013]
MAIHLWFSLPSNVLSAHNSPARFVSSSTYRVFIQSQLIHQLCCTATAHFPLQIPRRCSTSSAFNTLSLSHLTLSLIPPNPGLVSPPKTPPVNTLRLDIHPKKLFPHWPGLARKDSLFLPSPSQPHTELRWCSASQLRRFPTSSNPAGRLSRSWTKNQKASKRLRFPLTLARFFLPWLLFLFLIFNSILFLPLFLFCSTLVNYCVWHPQPDLVWRWPALHPPSRCEALRAETPQDKQSKAKQSSAKSPS